MWETLHQNAGCVFFQDSDFACDLADSKSTSGSVLCTLGSHTFVSISCTCKKKGKQQYCSRHNLIGRTSMIGRNSCTPRVGHRERCVCVDLPSQNLAQNRQYRDTIMCLPAHNEQRLVKVVKVQIICTRSGRIVILLPPTDQQGSRNNQRYRMNQRCTIMTKLVLCSEPHACAQTAVRQEMIVR